MLNLKNLNGYYGNSRALKDVNIEVGDREFLSVLGRNGVGKTTLMRAIFGLLDKTEGEILFDGADLIKMPTHERARAGIGYVPQGRGILPQFTVGENLKMGGFARSSDRGEELETLVFEMFPILKEFIHRKGGNLSGGQQQQLAIGRALLTDPKVIVLDEPTEGIQPNIVQQIEDAIISLNKDHNITILLVEQDIKFSRRASSRFVILEKGSVVSSGAIAELSDDLVHEHMAV